MELTPEIKEMVHRVAISFGVQVAPIFEPMMCNLIENLTEVDLKKMTEELNTVILKSGEKAQQNMFAELK